MTSTQVRLDQLVGREVLTVSNRRLGRLEDCRVERSGSRWLVTGWQIGPAGLFERVRLAARLLVGAPRDGYFARWDQIDLSDPELPRLRCVVDALKRL